jgi:hypothetical protein
MPTADSQPVPPAALSTTASAAPVGQPAAPVGQPAAAPQPRLPQPRPLPSWLRRAVDPPQAVAELLRRHQGELAAARADAAAGWDRADSLAAAVGLTLARKRAALGPADFRVLGDLLQAERIEVLTHVGEPLTPELDESADVVEWGDPASAPGPGDWVAEAYEPEIRFEGRLVRRAKLCCVRGPDRPEADTPPTSPPDAAPTAPPDAPPDAAPTAPPDTPPHAAPTAPPDTPPDAAPTAPPTSPPDAAPTTSPDAAPTAPPADRPDTRPTEGDHREDQ